MAISLGQMGWVSIAMGTSIAALSGDGCCTPPDEAILGTPLYGQQASNWCWAATTQMIGEHFGVYKEQCQIANVGLDRTDCCGIPRCPAKAECNVAGYLQLDAVGVVAYELDSSLVLWSEIKRYIGCVGTPLAFAYGLRGSVGHIVVVAGYDTIAEVVDGVEEEPINYLVVNNSQHSTEPCAGEMQLVSYDAYGSDEGTHPRRWTKYNMHVSP